MLHEPGSDKPRAKLIARIACPADKRLFLIDSRPLRGQQIKPDVARIPGKFSANVRQARLELIVINRAGNDAAELLLRESEPVGGVDFGHGIEGQIIAEKSADG